MNIIISWWTWYRWFVHIYCLFHVWIEIGMFNIFFFNMHLLWGKKYGWKRMQVKKVDIRKKIEIVEQKSLFFFFFFNLCQDCKIKPIVLLFFFICRLVTIFFFFFDFYRWPRFNSLLIRCCSFRGSFADPNRVLELAELFSFFFPPPLSG